MKRLATEQMHKLEESIALEIDKALSPHPDNPQEFVKDLSIIQEFIAKQLKALTSDKSLQTSTHKTYYLS